MMAHDQQRGLHMKTMTVKELKEHMARGTVVLIDVREVDEFAAASIEGAHLIPLGQVSVDALPETDLPIVIHCRSGKRSASACDKLLDEDEDLDLYNLEGGIMAWEAAGFPVTRSTS